MQTDIVPLPYQLRMAGVDRRPYGSHGLYGSLLHANLMSARHHRDKMFLTFRFAHLFAHLYYDVFLAFVRVHLLHHAAEATFDGMAMLDELQHHGYRLSPGTLYPILHSLGKAGYLSVVRVVVEGKARKYYRITGAGRDALKEVKPKLRELVAEVLSDSGGSG
jgi:PadR family transcriptional regulator PadR